MFLLLAPITPKLFFYAVLFFIVIPYLMYDFKHPRSQMFEEKKQHPFFNRLENTGRLKIKQYYLFDFILIIIILDETSVKKYYYFHGLKKNKYIKFATRKKQHANISTEKK